MAQVTCARCRNTREGAGNVGLPGPLGEAVEGRVCAECWKEWLSTQVRVINHYGLRPAVKEDRERIYGFAREFLNLGDQA
ncbi:MAG: Fe(2+)-trafficking protein [Candidatus Limnocylindria bacterium]|nr:Fe(2+)-trafficking protein [Chloroflexota bacterium]